MRKKLFAFFTGAMIVGAMAGQAASAAAYEVQQGDTLWSISEKHGTSIQQLKSWNNLSSDLIFPKQQLHTSADEAVNNEADIDDVYTVKSGDSLWKISQKLGLQVNQLKSWNQLTSDLIHPGQQLAVKENGAPVQVAKVNTAPQQTAPVQREAAPAQPEPKQAVAPASKEAPAAANTEGKELTVTATAYTAYCNGCSGVTATGIDLRANPGQKVIAVDPSVIPLGSKVHVEGYGTAIAGDTGGAIKGNKIDIFVPSKSEAVSFGVKTVKIKVLN
ncbi:cell wall protein [Bacillus freudenreichii]|nr:cell wall protein [Bacillus freudenreichii]